MSGCAGGGSDTEKQLVSWGRRARLLRRMVLGFAQARPPDPPNIVAVDIIASSLVEVHLQEATTPDGPITTKFKSKLFHQKKVKETDFNTIFIYYVISSVVNKSRF